MCLYAAHATHIPISCVCMQLTRPITTYFIWLYTTHAQPDLCIQLGHMFLLLFLLLIFVCCPFWVGRVFPWLVVGFVFVFGVCFFAFLFLCLYAAVAVVRVFVLFYFVSF